jgi:hypothetical protein
VDHNKIIIKLIAKNVDAEKRGLPRNYTTLRLIKINNILIRSIRQSVKGLIDITNGDFATSHIDV